MRPCGKAGGLRFNPWLDSRVIGKCGFGGNPLELRGVLCCQREDSGVTTQVDNPKDVGCQLLPDLWGQGWLGRPGIFPVHRSQARKRTNTKRALLEVYNMMSRDINNLKETWNRLAYVIIIMTDMVEGLFSCLTPHPLKSALVAQAHT